MTVALEIATPFADFSELSENFAQRVDTERLMLPYQEPVAEGEWVTFTVLFADGSTALAGTGKCQGSYDNGEEHPPEYRFDVVVEQLSLEGTAEVMFERLLMARSSMTGEPSADPATGEVSIDELERQQAQQAAPAAEDEEAPAAEEPAGEVDAVGLESVEADLDGDAGGFDEPQATAVAQLDDLVAETAQRSQPPPAPRGSGRAGTGAAGAAARARPGVASAPAALPSPHSFNGTVLTRPTLPAAWSPEPEARPDAAMSSGAFDYGRGGLPKPAHPPRPELAAEARVQLAPAPGRPAQRRVAAAPEAAEPAEYEAPEAADETSQYDIPSEDEPEA